MKSSWGLGLESPFLALEMMSLLPSGGLLRLASAEELGRCLESPCEIWPYIAWFFMKYVGRQAGVGGASERECARDGGPGQS